MKDAGIAPIDAFPIVMEMLLVAVCILRVKRNKRPIFSGVIGGFFAIAVAAKVAEMDTVGQFAETFGYMVFALFLIVDMRWKYQQIGRKK